MIRSAAAKEVAREIAECIGPGCSTTLVNLIATLICNKVRDDEQAQEAEKRSKRIET